MRRRSEPREDLPHVTSRRWIALLDKRTLSIPHVPLRDRKYDRQLRIWGAHGQQLLESSRVCLLHCGPTGSETLKNLVLGGIAAFTVVDDAKVQPHDLGNNFLLDSSSLGKSKAQHVTTLLEELNESVAGSFVEESPSTLLETNPDFFLSFTLVIATQMIEPDVIKLEDLCHSLEIKLLVVRSYGLVGSLRASLQEQTVIESKPDNHVENLRFHKPWRELEDFAMSIDLATADDILHKHTPYAILLIQATKQWHATHGPELPQNAREKQAYRDILQSWQRRIDDVPIEEENFTEAIENSRKVFAPPGIGREVQMVLYDPKAMELDPRSSDFWVLAAALRDFVEGEGEGCLPIEGSIPDMWATTELFLALQRVYRDKAERDTAAVRGHLARRLASIGRDAAAIDAKTLRNFVKHAHCLRVVRWRRLAQEVAPGTCDAAALRQALGDEDTAANACLYLLLRAVDRFHTLHARFPGCYDGEFEDDVPLLKSVAVGMLAEVGLASGALVDDLVHEVVRCGTLVYNAMASTTSVFQF
ncbi:hypothetical protein WJX73_000766 [Symbiochloris irregularis]|uniref:NEDD8-activating enzyme E1 regulatory subunit n=1 Tax=Symbiochloris irregularis TaxID=706552 RepID=A0AAW1NZ26_9CHLO